MNICGEIEARAAPVSGGKKGLGQREARESRVSPCEDLPASAFFVDGTQIHSPVLLKVKKDVSP